MDLKESIEKIIEEKKKELEAIKERWASDLDWRLKEAIAAIEDMKDLAGSLPSSFVELLDASRGRLFVKAFDRKEGPIEIGTRISSLDVRGAGYQLLWVDNCEIGPEEDFQVLVAILPLKKKSE